MRLIVFDYKINGIVIRIMLLIINKLAILIYSRWLEFIYIITKHVLVVIVIIYLFFVVLEIVEVKSNIRN